MRDRVFPMGRGRGKDAQDIILWRQLHANDDRMVLVGPSENHRWFIKDMVAADWIDDCPSKILMAENTSESCIHIMNLRCLQNAHSNQLFFPTIQHRQQSGITTCID